MKETAMMALLMWTVNLMHLLLDERQLLRVVLLTGSAAVMTAYLTLMRYGAVAVVPGFAVGALLLARRGAFGWTRALAMSGAIGASGALTLAAWLYYDKHWGGGGEYVERFESVYSGRAQTAADRAVVQRDSRSTPAAREPILSTITAMGSCVPERLCAALRRFLLGTLFRINDIGCLTVPGLWKSSISVDSMLTPAMLVFLALFGIVGFGWWRVVRTKFDLLAFTLPAYFLLYVHWVCDQPGGRFMLPMLPIIAACAWHGIAPLVRRPAAVFGLVVLAHLGQAGVYWLLIDAPRAYHAHRNWPLVKRLSENMRERAGEVAIGDSVLHGAEGLWLELGWNYRLKELEPVPNPKVAWIVEQAGREPRSGFSVRYVDGPLQLLGRDPPTGAGTPIVQSAAIDACVDAGLKSRE
jgi:hypothetical protein